MVKVWNSAIDDNENKRPIKKKTAINDESDSDNDRKIRTVIYLEDFNTTLSIWAIESIEKKSRFVETPHPRWQFGIVINADIEQSIRFPKVDVGAWYEKEEFRDKKYDQLLSKLERCGFRILQM